MAINQSKASELIKQHSQSSQGTNLLSPDRAAGLVGSWVVDPLDIMRRQCGLPRYTRPTSARHSQAHHTARLGLEATRERLATLGYKTDRTTHKCAFDLWIEDAIRAEVKTANWRPARHGGRYFTNIRSRQLDDADLVIFACKNGTWHFFIIPTSTILPAHTLTITTQQPENYTGKWSPYLDAWPLLTEAVDQAPPRPTQLNLFQEDAHGH